MGSDNIQLACVQPPTSLHHGRDGHHGQAGHLGGDLYIIGAVCLSQK